MPKYNMSTDTKYEIPLTLFPEHRYIDAIKVVGIESNSDPAYVRGTGWFERSGKVTPPECRYSIIQMTLSGSGLFDCHGRQFPLLAGTGFITHSMAQEVTYSNTGNDEEAWDFVYLEIFGDSMRNFIEELTNKSGPVFHFDLNSDLIHRLMSFKHFSSKNCFLPLSEQQGIIGELKQLILSGYTKQFSSSSKLVERAIYEINSLYHEQLTVNMLAKRLNVSREYLSRQFRTVLNISPYQYILRKKLIEGTELIKSGTLSIKEISARLGFSSPTIFGRQFKEQFGFSPSEIRNKSNDK